MVKHNKVKSENGYFYPFQAIQQYNNITFRSIRSVKRSASYPKINTAAKAGKILSFIPWVKLVCVTGALAMENVDETDDIDLMVVTAKNRLWIVRPLAVLLVGIFFKRRKPSWSNKTYRTNLANTICLNLWLDELALKIPSSQRDLYTAHELAQMKPIVNKGRTYERMMAENAWGGKFLANVWGGQQQTRQISQIRPAFAKGFVEARQISLISSLNRLAFRLQLIYMQSKMTTERVSLHAAYFHPGNLADTILTEYDNLRHRNF